MAMDPYKILGISQGASAEEVKRAYRKKARENHPDLNPGDASAAKRMNDINEAYDRITNPDKYAAEDARRAAADRNAGRSTGQTYQRPGQSSSGQNQSGQAGQQGPYGWSGDFGFEDLFGGFYTTGAPIHPEASVNDSPEIRQAINLVNSKNFKEANKILYQVKSTDRNARWYYIIALSNHGLNNTMLAMDQIKKACELDPNNNEYKMAARSIQASGKTYRQTSQQQGFTMNFMNPTTLCCICLGLNLCMGGGFGVPLCFRFH